MGWALAGLMPDSGKSKRFTDPSSNGLAFAKAAADRVAKRFGVMRIDAKALRASAPTRRGLLYVFDVRDPTDYAAGHFPGAVNAPGGQLVQATDQYAATLGARIVLIDDREVRAVMTASWLKQMGWRECSCSPQAAARRAGRGPGAWRAPSPRPRHRGPGVVRAGGEGPRHHFRYLAQPRPIAKGHIPGAWFAIRTRLSHALAKVPMNGELVLTSEDGVLAGLAAGETRVPSRYLRGGNAAWEAAGVHPVDRGTHGRRAAGLMAEAYERTGDTKGAMNEYLSWEVDLLPASLARRHHAVQHAGLTGNFAGVKSPAGAAEVLSTPHEIPRRGQGLHPLRRRRQRLCRVPAREVHRARRPGRAGNGGPRRRLSWSRRSMASTP